ncbi:MAG: hypothetical protein AAF985_13905 [Bacteroidota bacterium]
MLNLQRIIQELKTQKMDLLVDHKITAGFKRAGSSTGSKGSRGSRGTRG